MDIFIALVMWSQDMFQICDLGSAYYVHAGRVYNIQGVPYRQHFSITEGIPSLKESFKNNAADAGCLKVVTARDFFWLYKKKQNGTVYFIGYWIVICFLSEE